MGSLGTPRKQRTREHVIAAQSVNFVERYVIDEGHVGQRVENDYGYDLYLLTFDEEGYAEPGIIFLQLKAAETLKKSKTNFVFDVDVRDYTLWINEPMPVILVLFDASGRKAYWLHVQPYFRARKTRGPKKGARTARVRVPERQRINRRAIARMRAAKQAVLDRSEKGMEDA